MVVREIECVVCGTMFTFDVRGRAPVTCGSSECKKKREYESVQKWRRETAKIPESAHGTLNGYVVYGCQCDACLGVRSEYQRGYRRQQPKTDLR